MKKWVFALAVVAFGVAIPAAVAEDGPFSDVPANFWAADAIYELEEAEIIEETPDKTYNPDEAIQRDEAIQILAKALELDRLESLSVPAFLDFQPGDFAYKEAVALIEQGILENTKAFNPNEILTRGEAAELLVKAFDLQLPEDAPAFNDVPGPHWAHEYARIVASLGILEGATANTFEPDEEVSRAYFAVIIDRALDYAASLSNETTGNEQEETPVEEPVLTEETPAEEPQEEASAEEAPAEETPAPTEGEYTEEAPAEEESAAPTGIYTVKNGDTLYRIALNAGVSVEELKQWNHLQSNFIDIGQELKVPSSFAQAEGTQPANEEPVEETPAKETPIEEEPAEETQAEEPAEEQPVEQTAPAKETAPAVSGDEGLSADEQRSIELVNLERSKTGASPVVVDQHLNRIAQAKAEDMAVNHYFDHMSPTYGSPFEMAYDFGYSYLMYGENLAIGYTTPGSAMTGWMGSDSHRTNLLNPGYTQMGAGHAVDEAGTDYWVHLFSRQ